MFPIHVFQLICTYICFGLLLIEYMNGFAKFKSFRACVPGLPLRRDHFAWFFVVDDDLYMNRENANLALSAFDPSTEIALGWSAHGFKNELGIITFFDRQFTSIYIQIEIVNPDCFMWSMVYFDVSGQHICLYGGQARHLHMMDTILLHMMDNGNCWPMSSTKTSRRKNCARQKHKTKHWICKSKEL